MNTKKWLLKNTESLEGKRIAVTGTTGGIGKELCRYLASLGASLILMDRNPERSESFRSELIASYPLADIVCLNTELEDMESVKNAAERLKNEEIDVFIHNAGAYSIPRHKCSSGYDNVFQINFASPYYIIKEILPTLEKRGGKVVAVGSIAHNYSKYDERDIDFSERKRASKVYGNAKRYLMFSLYGLFKDANKASLSIAHPGITFTNITAHYPKVIFAVIKHPMKVIFMKPKKAALSILKGVFEKCEACEWIGPRAFNVWGLPSKKKLHTCSDEEMTRIFEIAETVYSDIKNKLS